MPSAETSFETPPPIFDAQIVRTNSYSNALSKANRGKTLDDVASAAEQAMTFTTVLKRRPGGSYGVAVGSTKDQRQHVVHSLKDMVAARESGAFALMVNDLITKIGTDTLRDASELNHEEFIQFMTDNDVLLMEIQRPHKDYRNVELVRGGPEGKLGITMVTVGEDLGLTVNSVFGNALGKLENGDRLIACNGRLLRTMSHGEAQQFIGAHDHITLTVERSPAILAMVEKHMQAIKSDANLASRMSEIANLVITRPSLSVGWGLHLGETHGTPPKQVIGDHNHPGILMRGDVITVIDGFNVSDMSHDQMVHRIQSATRVTLTVERSLGRVVDPDNSFNVTDLAVIDTSTTLNIVRDSVESPMGFVFGTRDFGGHVVREVTAGLPAQRAGLEPYDLLLAVNGTEVGELNHDDVLALLRETANVELLIDRGAETARQHSDLDAVTDSLGNPQQGESDLMIRLVRKAPNERIGCGIGTNQESRVIVTDVVEGSVAETAGLKKNDEILKVAGKPARDRNHDDVVNDLTSSLDVALLIRRNDEDYGSLRWQRPHLSDNRETVQITLSRESAKDSFGFGIGHTNQGKHFITEVKPELEPFDLRVHDEIIAIKGEDVTGWDHNQIVDCIFGAGLELSLTVLRDADFDADEDGVDADVDVMGHDRFEVTLTRADLKSSFGFGLGTTPQLTKVITNLNPELEDKDELRVADIIEEINGDDVTSIDHDACVELVRSSGLKIVFKVARSVVEKEGRDHKRRASIRVVDPSLAAEVEDTRTDKIE